MENDAQNEAGTVEIGGLICVNFNMPAIWKNVTSSNEIILNFHSLEGKAEQYRFRATLADKGNHRISFFINPAKGENLPDGEYLVRGQFADGDQFIERVGVTVKDKVVTFAYEAPQISDKIKGIGSSSAPYEISSYLDFLAMLDMLHDDKSRGCSLYFKQMADLHFNASEGIVDENGWISEEFAGHYDGGGFSINGLHYIGNDSYLGLFRKLHAGAIIENLTVDVKSITTTGNYIGAIAGASYGSVQIKNCNVTGNLTGNDYVGGVVGYASESLKIDNLDLAIVIKNSNNYVGGVVGYAYRFYDSAHIRDVTTKDRSFEIKGNNYVGGLIGYSYFSCIKISGVNLIHTVYSAEDVVIIGGNSYVGGLIGFYENCYTSEGGYPDIYYYGYTSEIKESSVCCTINATGNYIGGIIGQLRDDSGMYMQDFKFTNVGSNSSIVGKDVVGGFIGSNSKCQLYFNNCSVETKNLNLTYVKGENKVGGFFGENNMDMKEYKNLEIAVNVTATKTNAGGFIGYLDPVFSSYIDLSALEFTSTMIVEGEENIGGFAGYAANSAIWGSNNIEFSKNTKEIPQYNGSYDFSVKVTGKKKVGGLIGKGHYVNAHNIGISSQTTGNEDVGGIVGYAHHMQGIHSCTVSGIVSNTESGTCNIGGIAGSLVGGSITQCINYSKVTGNANTGGIAGAALNDGNTPYVEYCVNTGSVTGECTVGGVIGLLKIGLDDLVLATKYCANYGQVTCNDGTTNEVRAFGGIIGASSAAGSSIYGCANHGNVTGNLSAHGGGGIVGSMGNDPSGAMDSKDANNYVIESCINTGDISNTNKSCHLGGIVGYAEEGDDNYSRDAAIFGCLNTGKITSVQDASSAGIAGYIDWYAQIEYCCCTPDLGTDISLWYGDYKYGDNLIIEGYRVKNNVTYNDSSNYDCLFSNSNYKYWEKTSGSKPILADCPFQSVTYTAPSNKK